MEKYEDILSNQNAALVSAFLANCGKAGATHIEAKAWTSKKQHHFEGKHFVSVLPIVELSVRSRFAQADEVAHLFEVFIKEARQQELHTPEWYAKMELSFSSPSAFVAEKPDMIKFSVTLNEIQVAKGFRIRTPK